MQWSGKFGLLCVYIPNFSLINPVVVILHSVLQNVCKFCLLISDVSVKPYSTGEPASRPFLYNYRYQYR